MLLKHNNNVRNTSWYYFIVVILKTIIMMMMMIDYNNIIITFKTRVRAVLIINYCHHDLFYIYSDRSEQNNNDMMITIASSLPFLYIIIIYNN